jgi:hypothetical protein
MITKRKSSNKIYSFVFFLLLLGGLLFCKHFCFQSQPQFLATGILHEIQENSPQNPIASLIEDEKYDEILAYLEDINNINLSSISATLIRAEIYANHKNNIQHAIEVLEAALLQHPADWRIQDALDELKHK